jgi:hypothetical protein
MRRTAFVTAIILSGLLAVARPEPAAASVAIGVSVMFHDSLSPYGDWVDNSRFGVVWVPRRVDHGWRPYTRGHWVYTDYEWTWVSDEDWGWATYHYGRWYSDPDEGWVWIPGDQWAPAWVAWRYGGGYVGWAPLPPQVDVFRAGFEVRIDPFAYSFVEERRLCDNHVYRQFVPEARNVTFVSTTQNVTSYAVVDHRVVNRGIDVQRFERASGRAVPRLQVREVTSASDARGGRVQHGQVAFFRPTVSTARSSPEPRARALAQPRAEATRPDQLMRRQEKERQQLQSAERHERNQLQKIQQREDRHPLVAAEGRGHPPAAREERHPPVAAEGRSHPPMASEGRGTPPASAARPAPAPPDHAQLRARHEAEQKAQAEHEQRESHVLQHRQEREQRAVQAHPQNEQPKKTAAKRDHQ